MLFLLNKNIKTIFLFLLFITIGIHLNAGNIKRTINEKTDQLNPENIAIQNDYKVSDATCNFSKDTVLKGKNELGKTESPQNNQFSVPLEVANKPINFTINSTISYLSFNDFVNNGSKKLFFQAWLKEIELLKLSGQTDSLRKAYGLAASDQKEVIAEKIINAEKQTMAFNAEIPEMYQKAREEENRYWQSASPDKINKFHEKINLLKDSIAKVATLQTGQESAQAQISDTLTLYKPSPKSEENKAAVPGGIVYKIQIGAFKGKIPEASNRLIKKISIIRKVENYLDVNGLKVYTTGNLRLYAEAVKMLSQVKQEGIKNAVINAYQNGKKITVVEARKLNKEL